MAWNGYGFKKPIDTCNNCTKREIGCHATCEDYINAKREWEELKAKINAEKWKAIDYDAFRFETVVKRRATRERKAKKRHR